LDGIYISEEKGKQRPGGEEGSTAMRSRSLSKSDLLKERTAPALQGTVIYCGGERKDKRSEVRLEGKHQGSLGRKLLLRVHQGFT